MTVHIEIFKILRKKIQILQKKSVMIIFYVAVIMNLEKSDFFKSNFRPEGVKIGQSRGNIKFLEASKDIKNEIKI